MSSARKAWDRLGYRLQPRTVYITVVVNVNNNPISLIPTTALSNGLQARLVCLRTGDYITILAKIAQHILISHGQMRPPGPLVALRLIFAAPVPSRDQLVFALHCTSTRTYTGYSTGCGEGGSRSKRPPKSTVSSTSVYTSSSFPSTPSESEGHHVGTETKRHKK